MARKASHLSVATDADADAAALKARRQTQSLADAAEGEDYLTILIAQRREMIRSLADIGGPALAAMHRQIAMHSKEIAALQASEGQEAAEDDEAADEEFDASAI